MDRCLVLGLFAILQILQIGLAQQHDACDECRRHPKTCRRISGLFTVTVMTEGSYNPVVEIPYPACNINITEFQESRNYIGVKTKSDQGIVNSYWSLDQPGHYRGAGTQFTYEKNTARCRGTCIYADGPTTEAIVVQIFYHAKNPGIAYTFTIPNSVSFTPFGGVQSRIQSPSQPLHEAPSTSRLEAPSTSRLEAPSNLRLEAPSTSRHEAPSASRHNITRLQALRRHRQRLSMNRTSEEFTGEVYTGSQSNRSEGRPESTSSLTDGTGVRGRYDYTGSRYGTHTLGGRGQSYTHAGDSQSHVRKNIRRQPARNTSRHRTPAPNVLRRQHVPEHIAQVKSNQPLSAAHHQIYPQTTSYQEAYHVVDNYDGQNYHPIDSGYPGQGSSEYRWKIAGFTDCSHPCGGGTQNTNIVCISSTGRTQVVVTPENCAAHLKPNSQTVQCNTAPCEPVWEAKEWSACSVTCGSGTQTRIVVCQQRLSPSLTLKVSADQCGLAEKPAVAQQCEVSLCAGWQTGAWSQCSKECGGGERQREVRCVDKTDSHIPANYCTQPAPVEVEQCNTHSCTTQWWISQWSECSESCGKGQRSRSAVCVNDKGHVISHNSCDHQDVPKLKEVCQHDTGCGGVWFVGTWSKCTPDCGNGVRTRQVVCLKEVQSVLSIVRDEDCQSSLKPTISEPCVNTGCSAKWYTSPWSECSVTCGEGRRTRQVRCIEDNRRPSSNCDNLLKPEVQKVCSQQSCNTRHQHEPDVAQAQASNSHYRVHSSRTNTTEVHYRPYTEQYQHQKPQNLVVPGSQARPGKDIPCQDSYWNCRRVIQAGLCYYFRESCCACVL
ncbi:ADAMTS-like protein 4 [Physella acuta]|uniref:ADAMTS-like protein 4 n=1 Tax=Physella acuta TaxID=109671 RepID=UPI0027DE77BD|nr:ADAMTS-like protein 4 [Physella acuta]